MAESTEEEGWISLSQGVANRNDAVYWPWLRYRGRLIGGQIRINDNDVAMMLLSPNSAS
jgi:hypothetical protein